MALQSGYTGADPINVAKIIDKFIDALALDKYSYAWEQITISSR